MVKQRTRHSPQRLKQPGKGGCRAPSWGIFARLAPGVLALTIFAGCSGMNHNATGGSAGVDPLLGGPGLKATVPAAPQSAPPGASASVLPVPPSSNTPASTAALAAGMTKPFDKDHDLRIGNPGGNTGSEGWARQGVAQVAPANGNGSGAVLTGVIPAAAPVARQDSAQNPPTPAVPVGISAPTRLTESSAVKIASYEQAEALLAARGALWHHLDKLTDTGEWRFSCIVPNRQKPGTRRTYEARDRDSLSAVQAVIDQIDREQP